MSNGRDGTWRRPPPAPATGRKPQAGAAPDQEGRRSAVIGPRLTYLSALHSEGSLASLVQQEHDLWHRELSHKPTCYERLVEWFRRLTRSVEPEARFPSPLTAAVRLKPAEDPLLNLSAEAIARLDRDRRSTFDPSRPAVAISIEFLGSRADLLPLGVIPAVQAGDIFFGWVNLDGIAALAKQRAVIRAEALNTWRPTSSGSGGAGGGSGSGVNVGETGAGVSLAVIDLGFDFLHPALLRPLTSSEDVRALWLHDFNEPPPVTAPAGSLGRRFTGDDLGQALAWYNGPASSQKPDAIATHMRRLTNATGSPAYRTLVQQHGTAVGGIAAGNGRASSSSPAGLAPGPGIAPDADLLLVAIGAHDEKRFADALDVHKAFEAAFEGSTAACVALMANSDNLGPHDGTLAGEQALDDMLLWPGRAIVLSAGNLNHHPSSATTGPAWHAVASASSGGPLSLPLVLKYGSGASWPDSAEVWFRTPGSAVIAIKIRGTAIGSVQVDPTTAPSGSLSAPVPILTEAQNPSHRTRAEALLVFDATAQAYCLQLFFRPALNREIVPSEWSITVPDGGSVHAWLDRNNNGIGHWTGSTAQAGAGVTTLGSPAVATRPLTVGSIADTAGNSSTFSGRGPVRAPQNGPRKPDLVAVGEGVSGPRAAPADRWNHTRPSGAYRTFTPPGTSYAAPQVAGACLLLFERFGAAATWADIRQAILQSTRRTGNMPAPEPDGWDSACGFGMLDLAAVAPELNPLVADMWLSKSLADDGTEPFVAMTFWESPDLRLEDDAGRFLTVDDVAAGISMPARLRVRLRNRGSHPATDPVVAVWWAPLGAIHPLPHPVEGGGAWRKSGLGVNEGGNLQRTSDVAPGEAADVIFDWSPPRDQESVVIPHVLIATVGGKEDPFDPSDTLCAQNNAAALNVAASRSGARIEFHIIGSDDIDGVIIFHEAAARIRIEGLPVSALPWRDSQMFEEAGRSERPLYGSKNESDDLAVNLARRLEGTDNISAITDVTDAEWLQLANGLVTIEGGGRMTLPRLRIAPGADLTLNIRCAGDGGMLHMLHLSGGRRVGGGSARILM